MTPPSIEIVYSEIDRIVHNAYHGTYAETARTILKKGFDISRGDKLHLGDGVYFYENSSELAWGWCSMKRISPAAVLKCTISLGKCLDLTTQYFQRRLFEFHRQLRERFEASQHTRHLARKLTDTALVNYVAQVWGPDTIRCEFGNRSPITPGGLINLVDSRTVICVRSRQKISGLTLEPEPPKS